VKRLNNVLWLAHATFTKATSPKISQRASHTVLDKLADLESRASRATR
jgi:hypothetical protein